MKHRRIRGRKWANVRRVVLERDRFMCAIDNCEAHADEVDHITPLHLGGTNSLGNLQAICGFHHRQKTAGELRAVMQRKPDPSWQPLLDRQRRVPMKGLT